METTLAIIKPDALEARFKNDILHMIHKYKFTILKAGRFKVWFVFHEFNLWFPEWGALIKDFHDGSQLLSSPANNNCYHVQSSD